MKLQTGSYYSKRFTSRRDARQNRRTNQIIRKKITKTKWSNTPLILKSVQKWNKLPSSIRNFNRKTCCKKVNRVFALPAEESTR